MRKCSKCNRLKPLRGFYKSGKYHRPDCIECSKKNKRLSKEQILHNLAIRLMQHFGEPTVDNADGVQKVAQMLKNGLLRIRRTEKSKVSREKRSLMRILELDTYRKSA